MRLNWYGTFSAGQGYSGSSEQTALALDRRDDTDVYVVSPKTHKVPDGNVSPEGKELKKKPFKHADVAIAHGFPNLFSSIQGYKYRVGYTMFETDRLPDGNNEWTGKFDVASKAINEQLDLLLTPSSWCVSMFRDNGVTIPIEVVPNGVHPTAFPYYGRPERETFTFLDMATLTIRKNPGAVITAFSALFRDKPEVRLVLKTQSGTLGHVNFGKDMGNITVIDSLYTMDEMTHLLQQADCFVFPSRGEGFGMPPIEAMATGLPTIVSYNTGMMDYADERYCYPVKLSHKTPAIRYPKKWGYVGNWYEPDYEDLKRQMLHVYENQDEARNKGKLASEEMHRNWNYDVVADKMVQAIAKHFPEAV